MLSAFHPDAVAYHFQATNDVIDRDGEDEVMVKYHERLIRHEWPVKEAKVESGADKAGPALKHEDGLPALLL